VSWYIGTQGKMGACPEDYLTFKAAQFCGVPPWELQEQSMVWKYKALEYMSAEAEGEKILADHNSRK
jgi:hypothetical protein